MRASAARGWSWLAAGVFLAAGIGFALPGFVEALRTLGRYVPQAHIELDYLVGLIWSTVIAVSIRFWPIAAADRRPLLLIWLAKVVVVLGLMLVYEWNYSLDAYGYYERASMPGFPAAQSAWSAGTALVAQFAWLHGKLLPDSYHALKVTFALVGLVAVYLIYRGTVRHRGVDDHRVLYFIALFPSVLFWSSIIGKDPLHLLGIALYAYGVVSWRATGRARHAFVIAAGVLLAFVIRSWSGPILLFPLLVFAMTGIRRPVVRVAFTLMAILAFAWTVDQFAAKFNIDTLRDVQTAAESRSRGWAGGSSQQRSTEFTSVVSMLRFAPVGAFAALFRPLPGEVRNPFGLVAGLENTFLLGLLLLAVARTRLRTLRDPVVTWALLLILTWSFVYSFVSYYNFGAAVRFKLQILPIFLLVLLYLARGGASKEPSRVPR